MNCLRCGKKAPDNASFCDECLKTVDEPLKESAYLNTQIHLAARKAPKEKTPAPREEKKPAEKKVKSRKGLIFAVVLLSLLCVLLGALCVRNVYEEYFVTDASANREILLQEENTRLSAAYSQLEKELAEAKQTGSDLREQISDLSDRIIDLEQALDGSRIEGSETDLALRETEQELQELLEEKAQYEAKLAQLEEEISTAQAQMQALNEEIDSLRTQNATLSSNMSFIDTRIAFINTGESTYHAYSCPYFTVYSPWLAYNVSNAKQNGYVPCTHCH